MIFDGSARVFVLFVAAIMYNRNKSLQYVVPKVFGLENHTHCVRHPRENFVKTHGKYGFR